MPVTGSVATVPGPIPVPGITVGSAPVAGPCPSSVEPTELEQPAAANRLASVTTLAVFMFLSPCLELELSGRRLG